MTTQKKPAPAKTELPDEALDKVAGGYPKPPTLHEKGRGSGFGK